MVRGQINNNSQTAVGEECHQAEEDQAGNETRLSESIGNADDAGSDDGVDQVGRSAEQSRLFLGKGQHLHAVERAGRGACRAAIAMAIAVRSSVGIALSI